MKILFVWPAAEISTWDVGRGISGALKRQGHEVTEYHTYNRFNYHAAALKAMGKEVGRDFSPDYLARRASETIVVDALEDQPDWIFITSALSVHPDSIVMCKRAGFRVAVLHTESPYSDEEGQAEFSKLCDLTFTNDRSSAERYEWIWLPHAYDPTIHRPLEADPELASDVLFVGTGWGNRRRLFEAVDWTGVQLRLMGVWPDLDADSPLYPFYKEGFVENSDLPRLYASTKIAINLHREDPSGQAHSLNPRTRELAACATFQVSDYRPELQELFGDTVPVFHTAGDLEQLVHQFLQQGPARDHLAREQWKAVQGETFDTRVKRISEALTLSRRRVHLVS